MNQKKNKEKNDQKATQPCLRLRAVTGRSDHKGDSQFCFSSKHALSIRLIAEYYFSADGRRASYSVDDIRSSTSHVMFSDSLHKLASSNRNRLSKSTYTNLHQEAGQGRPSLFEKHNILKSISKALLSYIMKSFSIFRMECKKLKDEVRLLDEVCLCSSTELWPVTGAGQKKKGHSKIIKIGRAHV